jgi:hypothetical protein
VDAREVVYQGRMADAIRAERSSESWPEACAHFACSRKRASISAADAARSRQSHANPASRQANDRCAIDVDPVMERLP